MMLDPYVRLPLEHDGKGTFSVRFKVRGWGKEGAGLVLGKVTGYTSCA